MAQKIYELEEGWLQVWRDINRAIWIIENSNDPEEYTAKEKEIVYMRKIEFLEGCVINMKIDDTRPWEVSEVSGLIYYTDKEENKND